MKIKNSIKYVTGIISFLIIITVGGYFILQNLAKSMFEGERHTGLDKTITRELFDSVNVGLQKYKLSHGHYPKTRGKYFFDSIKTLISISEVYIYSDSLTDNGKYIPIKKLVGERFDYRNHPNTYLGVGTKDLCIIYKYLSDGSFKLYSTGENHIDENGEGDDMVY